MNLDDLLQRLYSTDLQVYRAALKEILDEPDTAVETLFVLVKRTYNSTQPEWPIAPEEVQRQVSSLLSGDISFDVLLESANRMQEFRKSIRSQTEVRQNLLDAIVGLGCPAWEKMMELTRPSPKPYPYPGYITSLMPEFKNIISFDDALIALKHEYIPIRHKITVMLPDFDDERVVPTLLTILYDSENATTDGNFDIRQLAAWSLVDCGEKGIDALLDAHGANDTEVSYFAAVALMRTGDPRTLNIALDWLLSQDAKKRLNGLSGLDRMLDRLSVDHIPYVFDKMVQRIRQGDENSFSPASKVIAKFGAIAVEPMIALVEDVALDKENPQIRLYALDSLWQIHLTHTANLDIRLLQLAENLVCGQGNPELASAAAQALAQLSLEVDSGALLEAIQIHRDDPITLANVVYALGRKGNQRTLSPLRNLKKYWKSKPSTFDGSELLFAIDDAIHSIRERQR
jgi:HEAT repeat protein